MAALLGFALTLSASYWQFGRAETKAQLLQEYLARQAMAPHNLNASIPGKEALVHRRVRVEGQYVLEKAILLDNRIRGGAAGYEVIVPLQISRTGQYLLINRGWIERGRDRTVVPAIDAPSGTVTVTGTTDLPGRGALELSDEVIEGRIWQNLNLARYRNKHQLNVLDFVVQEESDRDDGISRDWAAPGFGIETHRSYAVQWLLFAALIVFLYVYYGFVRNKTDQQK
ncbi:MAG: SURF1 family protein [Betaproteobacteria bacterium]|jgi:surfeit locus 1 family protein|nr:MAG: SURF1 family protein [Betaproteobacteria bacterium]